VCVIVFVCTDRARIVFKERVNKVAFIKAEKVTVGERGGWGHGGIK